MTTRNMRLLGHFHLDRSAAEPALTSRKAIALLAYLALQQDRAAPRDVLASLLWENVELAQARTSLRQTIATIRRLEIEDFRPIVADAETVRLTLDINTDVAAFELLLETDPQAAVELYRGDLLSGFVLRDAPAFNEWLGVVQAQWRQRMVSILLEISNEPLATGSDLNKSAALALRLVAIDPYNEGGHRRLMQIYGRQGRTSLALAHYRDLADLLRRDLGVSPDLETRQLHDRLHAARRRGAEAAAVSGLAGSSHIQVPRVAAGTARIAVVDDEIGLLDAVATCLRLNGFEVVECADGAALDLALAVGRVDLVVLDVTMPGEDGFSIARRLAPARIPIIMLTARTELVDRVVGLELGADDYLGKPFELRELIARVRSVLRRTMPA